LIDKTNNSKLLIEDKDVLFVIGNTGSGKSTNILRFLGYNLKIGKFGKLSTLLPVEQLEP
jgi:ABC-type lipoprotein export system ATPase subunit